MICDVSDPVNPPNSQSVMVPPDEPGIRWWNRLSPWLWGLVVLLVIAAIAATQVPRLHAIFSAPAHKPSLAGTTSVPTLSGPVYTQAMVAGRNFAHADLRGALLAHLDLRGKNFYHVNAAGAVFAGSLLNGVNLSHADLRGADLRGACLRGAILIGARLGGADFTGADVTDTTITPAATSTAMGWASISSPSVCNRS